MASTSETGHAVNISNFKLLIDRCTGFGAQYNPSNLALTIANMTKAWTAANTAHTTFITAFQGIKEPINERQILFKPMGKLVTRVNAMLKSTKASDNVKADAKGIADKIRGISPKKPKVKDNGDAAQVKSISTSQQSFVQKADHFKSFIELLKTVTDYAPNEIELQTKELDNLYNSMKAANDGIGTTLTNGVNARIARDSSLYAENTGLVATAELCKNYVQGLFGSTNANYKLVSGIKFRANFD